MFLLALNESEALEFYGQNRTFWTFWLGNRLTHLQNLVHHITILELEYSEIVQMCNFLQDFADV